jgi:hypothetical protein
MKWEGRSEFFFSNPPKEKKNNKKRVWPFLHGKRDRETGRKKKYIFRSRGAREKKNTKEKLINKTKDQTMWTKEALG